MPVKAAYNNKPTANPFHESWMQKPVVGTVSKCICGLEYFTALDNLYLKRFIDRADVFQGYQSKRTYKVRNSLGQNIYIALEEDSCSWSRIFKGKRRPFHFTILDCFKHEVLYVYHPIPSKRCGCRKQVMEILSPPNREIGSVEQELNILRPQYALKNIYGNKLLRIVGPVCAKCRCVKNITFKILNMKGKVIGKIDKKWSGSADDFDTYRISFPIDLDVCLKALIFGSVFLIEFMLYNKNNKKNC